jgi:hypothetical protein
MARSRLGTTVADHILSRRARFWLAVSDAFDWLRSWALDRAADAIDHGSAEPDVEPERRPF